MTFPKRLARFNRIVTNPLMRHVVGIGPMAELEHVGRTSGAAYRTVLLAFRDGDRVTLALTYGPDVDWLKNVDAAGGGRMRLRGELLELGDARRLTTAEGLSRMPRPVRHVLELVGCSDFVELPVRSVRRR